VAPSRANAEGANASECGVDEDPRPECDTRWTLVGCVVTPGFEYEDFEIAEPEPLLAEFPEAADIIKVLT
jgi:predicted cupin superfamily sugar epimerase